MDQQEYNEREAKVHLSRPCRVDQPQVKLLSNWPSGLNGTCSDDLARAATQAWQLGTGDLAESRPQDADGELRPTWYS